MQKIKVAGLHPWMKDLEGIVKGLHIKDIHIISKLIYDEENPDIVIVTEHIYRNRKMFSSFVDYYKKGRAVLVFLGGEAVYPDMNVFDYAIGYSRNSINNDRITRIPPPLFFERTLDLDISDFKNKLLLEDAKLTIKDRKFCNFIYSNSNAHPMRDKLFYEISKYKDVESLGRHLNNMGIQSTREERNWGLLSVEMKSRYKFTIASENAEFEGYTSEKLLSTFMSHSIPIYWGNPDVADEYNEKAFVNCNRFSDFDSLISVIKEIDENDDLWAQMVSEPWQKPCQVDHMNKEIADYEAFLDNIFSYDSLGKLRRPLGTFISQYCDFFFREF